MRVFIKKISEFKITIIASERVQHVTIYLGLIIVANKENEVLVLIIYKKSH